MDEKPTAESEREYAKLERKTMLQNIRQELENMDRATQQMNDNQYSQGYSQGLMAAREILTKYIRRN